MDYRIKYLESSDESFKAYTKFICSILFHSGALVKLAFVLGCLLRILIYSSLFGNNVTLGIAGSIVSLVVENIISWKMYLKYTSMLRRSFENVLK